MIRADWWEKNPLPHSRAFAGNKFSPLAKARLKLLQAGQLNGRTVPLLEYSQIVHGGDRFPEWIGHLAKACFQHSHYGFLLAADLALLTTRKGVSSEWRLDKAYIYEQE